MRAGGRRGFTLIEMLTTVALLIILLGLMVSLARYVRHHSAEVLTRRLLVNLHQAMLEYTRQFGLPKAPSVEDGATLEESALQQVAATNNRQIVGLLKLRKGLSEKAFAELPTSVYDQATLRDAWGMPIMFMSAMHPQVGMARENE